MERLVSASLRQIQYVLAVYETGSIAKASRDMHISQSSILAAIDNAEQDLGARIFDRRKGRGVVLTAMGERYLAAARRLLSAEREFRHSLLISGTPHGPLRIGCFEPFGPIMMIDVLRKLRERIGYFEITLLETDQVSLKRALDRGEIDVAVIYDLGPDFDCTIEYIGRAPPHAMVHVDSPLARHDEISLEQLCREPISLLTLPLTTTYLMTLFDYTSQKPTIGFRSSHYETVIRAVSSGFGGTILNAWPANPLPTEANTKRLRLLEDLPAPNIVTADHYGDQKPPNLIEFIAELKEHVALGYRHLTPS
ncbi:LysR family transcriptional regulator [Pseudodonghicola flavimaris]|uniref:LysR family transcriptional regulator n=1 Tax=Pseudodonghicola flavimaris TaxID=3050036 RepID=A0ABT7F832_9RHOB|nr:LysR family transcriptional regulator [Pseudodonghicola flavimaris]MDK3020751.1 LysR family transcriptional regulator [Pseudodonghicola flavimaris]